MPFAEIKEASLKKALEREEKKRDQQAPFAKFEYVDVTFGTANQDTDIPHTLAPLDPESVRYVLIKSSAALSLYQDLSASRKSWQTTHIWLRASATGTARVLLFLEV